MSNYKQAVCIALPLGLSWETVVAVSRRNDPTRWGLPGGKVDPGETLEQAIRRETKEELGIDLPDTALVPIHVGYDGDFEVTTYMVEDRRYAVNAASISPEEGLTVTAMTQSQLCNPHNTPWPEYNTGVMHGVRNLRCRLPINDIITTAPTE
jgi:8-oxo-dGTP pyrophosphatase MutT (NUDIX family)